ncbi:unnamed protein product [Amoebophrya sp. A120]|nr:unnamed protein product [Amoebophrya sp. A120]|eukprot:GSA120T00004646001.1
MDEQNLHRAVSLTSSTTSPKMRRTTSKRTTPGPATGVVQQLLRLAVASTTATTSCGGPWPWSFLVQLQDAGCPGTSCNDIASSTTVKNMGAGVLLVSAFQVRLQQQKKATTMKKRVIQTKRGRGGQNAPAQKIPKNQSARPAIKALPKKVNDHDGQRAKGRNGRVAPPVVVDPAVVTEDVVDPGVADDPANGRTITTTDHATSTVTVKDDDRSTEQATNTNRGVVEEDEDNASVLSLTSTSFATSSPTTRRTSKDLVSAEKSESAKDYDYLTKVHDSSLAATSTSLLSTQSSSSHLDVCASETATCAQGKYREPVNPLCKCPHTKPLCLMLGHFDGRCFESKEACQKDETLLVDEQYPECLTVGEHMRCPECLENANVKRAVTEELCVAHDACVAAVWDTEKMGEPPILSHTGLPFLEDEEPPLLEALGVQQGKNTVAEAICCPSDKSTTTSGEQSSEIVRSQACCLSHPDLNVKPFKSFLGTSASAGSSAAADLSLSSTNNTSSPEQGLGGNGYSPGGAVQFLPNTSAQSQTAAVPPASGEEAAPKTGSSGTTAEGGAGAVDTSGAVCDTGLVISILVSIIVTVIVVTSAVALYCYFCVMGKDGYLSMPGVAENAIGKKSTRATLADLVRSEISKSGVFDADVADDPNASRKKSITVPDRPPTIALDPERPVSFAD